MNLLICRPSRPVKEQVLSVSVVERAGPKERGPQILLVKRPETVRYFFVVALVLECASFLSVALLPEVLPWLCLRRRLYFEVYV